jgi:CRISPR-associated protein Csc1
MHIYRLRLVVEEPLYYATRELGRSYQSMEYLHNYALTYALGLATSDYHDTIQVPHYREHLLPLNEMGVYVTPAKPERVTFVEHTFKLADTRYQARMEKSSVNVPNFGRVRELAVGSHLVAYAFSRESPRLPRWIRLGKWLSKTALGTEEMDYREDVGNYVTQHTLNPLDLPVTPSLFDLVNMPPVSLIENVYLSGPHYVLGDARPLVRLPANLAYRFP